MFAVFATLFYFSALFQLKYDDNGRDSLVALFALMYGAYQMGTAQTMVPDAAKAKTAAKIIF